MQKSSNEIEFLFPKEFDIEDFIRIRAWEPFADDSIEYLNAISRSLTKDPRVRNYPDVATFAFFCRRANVISLQKSYQQKDVLKLGRGVIFHVSPSNVPVNFAYSLICGLLTGNINIVRVPSKQFEQIDIIIDTIRKLSIEERFKIFSSRLAFVRYDKQSSATAYFSSICDVRVIWGGDSTIKEIRNNPLPPRSFDVTFADRYSLFVINADKYVNESAPEKIALGFFNDTYLFDQNACTAPHLIVWLGSEDNVKIAKETFWDNLHQIVKIKYNVQPIMAVDKLTNFFNQAIQLGNIKKTNVTDNLIWRVSLESLSTNIHEYRCSSGYFSEYHASSIFELSKIIDRKYQTLSYYGISKIDLINFVNKEKPRGIDRFVPVGMTTNFSLTWDGFNLIETLTRNIEIQV